MRDDRDRPAVPGSPRAVAHIGRVDDQTRRESQHLTREMEVLGTLLPERWDALVEHSVAEQPADDAALALHRVQVPVTVTPADRHPGDEMVEHEVVEDDHSG